MPLVNEADAQRRSEWSRAAREPGSEQWRALAVEYYETLVADACCAALLKCWVGAGFSKADLVDHMVAMEVQNATASQPALAQFVETQSHPLAESGAAARRGLDNTAVAFP